MRAADGVQCVTQTRDRLTLQIEELSMRFAQALLHNSPPLISRHNRSIVASSSV
jgi:hypothetical protein